ncbi:MAG: serine kinase [Pseudomonadota bacterium]
MTAQISEVLHATTVSVEGRGALIIGPSGSGKSGLALQLMAYGAALVADDRTCVTLSAGSVIATVPPAIQGLMEARNIGLLRLPAAGSAEVCLVVDMGQTEQTRLPEPRRHVVLGQRLPCVWHVPAPHFAAAVLQCLRHDISPRA